MKKTILLILSACLFLCFFGSCEKNGKYPEKQADEIKIDNTEKAVLNSLIKELDGVVTDPKAIDSINRGKAILEKKNIAAAEISDIIEELVKIKENYLKSPIIFADFAFEKIVKKYLKKATNESVNIEEANSVTELDLTYINDNFDNISRITRIDDVQHFKNLKKLTLKNNSIVDMTPLSTSFNLEELNISNNQLIDLTPLSYLKKLKKLNISDNKVLYLSTLGESLRGYTSLNLSRNQITDFSLLKTAESLQELFVDGCFFSSIDDFSQIKSLHTISFVGSTFNDEVMLKSLLYVKNLDLSGAVGFSKDELVYLTDLQILKISNSGITDISFISSMKSLISIDFSQNAITNFDFNENLLLLQKINLSKNLLTNVIIPPHKELSILDLSENTILSFFVDSCPSLTDINLSMNLLSTLNITNTPQIQSLNLSQNVFQTVNFTDCDKLLNLDISSNRLEEFNCNAKNLQTLIIYGNQLTNIDLSSFSSLSKIDLGSQAIQNISFIQELHSLRFLSVNISSVSDKKPLSHLENAEALTIYGIGDENLFLINGLKKLTNLTLKNCTITTPAISNLPALTTLKIIATPTLTDISAIKDLPSLKDLYISEAHLPEPKITLLPALESLSIISSGVENPIYIKDLPKLCSLILNDNPLKNLAFSLPKISYLDLSDCALTTILGLTLNINGGTLILKNNSITDLSPLSSLTSLTLLNITNNPITDTSILSQLTIMSVIGIEITQ